MIHYLPPTLGSHFDGFQDLAILAEDARELFSNRLEVDFSRCAVFDPNMAAPLAAVLAEIADRFNTIEIVRVPMVIERILRKNRFLVMYGYSPIEEETPTTIPLRRIQLSDEGLFAEYIQQHISGKGIPSISDALGRVLRQSIFEVFQNAVIHSQSRLGVFVCGQFLPLDQRLQLTLADAGVGIHANVQKFLGREISSADALRWVLEAGNTTKIGAQPGGVGLKFVKEFISANRGKLQIVSHRGYYEFCDGKDNFQDFTADFPGTTVNMQINTADTNAYGSKSEISPNDIF